MYKVIWLYGYTYMYYGYQIKLGSDCRTGYVPQ